MRDGAVQRSVRTAERIQPVRAVSLFGGECPGCPEWYYNYAQFGFPHDEWHAARDSVYIEYAERLIVNLITAVTEQPRPEEESGLFGGR